MIVYIGTYTHDVFGAHPTGSRGLYRCRLDRATGALTVLDAVSCENPSFLALSPDGQRLAVAEEKKAGGALLLFSVGEEGALAPLARQPLSGMECCYLAFGPDGGFLAGAHYGSGEAFAYAVTPEGFGEKTFSFAPQGSGPVADRQERAHVHSVRLIPALQAAAVCDLGSDAVTFWRWAPDGAMAPHELPSLAVAPGTGPRHTECSPDGQRLYLTGELSNQVLFYRLESGAYRLCQALSTLPGDHAGPNTAADLHFDGLGHLLVSNRGHDSLAVYDLSPDGTLSAPRWISTGAVPRHFAVAGEWLLCACQGNGEVQSFRLTEQGPAGPVSSLHVPSAVCVLPLG